MTSQRVSVSLEGKNRDAHHRLESIFSPEFSSAVPFLVPKKMSLQRTAFGLARGVRKFSNSPVVKSGDVHPGYKKIKPIQEHFNLEDGKPVHLKGGAFDSVLYGVTMALCVGAVAWDFKLYYDLAQR